MHACMHACMYVCMCVCVCMYVCMYVCMCVYVCMYVCVYVGHQDTIHLSHFTAACNTRRRICAQRPNDVTQQLANLASRTKELLPVMVDILHWSAWLPSDLEFSTLWTSALTRLRGHEASTDWGEPLLASYLEANLLEVSPDGSIAAAWQSGFGKVPVGFTTYAPNCIERSWRLLKSLLRSRLDSDR